MSLDLEDRLADAFNRIASRTVVDPLPPLTSTTRSPRRQILLRVAAVVVLAGGAVAGLVAARGDRPGESGDSVAEEAVPMPMPPALFDAPAATIEWAVVEPAGTIADAQIGSMVAGPGGFVAAGMGFENMADGQGRMWFSSDGESWEPVAYDLFREQGISHVTATSTAYYAVAAPEQDEGDPQRPGQLYRSVDGRTWEAVGHAEFNFGWVEALGDVLIRSSWGVREVSVSEDGETWVPASFDGESLDDLPAPPRFVELNGMYYTSTVSADGTRQPFWRSANGREWTSIPAPSMPGFPVATPSGLASIVVANEEECIAPADAKPEEVVELQAACRLRLRIERWTPGDMSWSVVGQVAVPTASWPRMWSFGSQLVAPIERPDRGLSIWTSADGVSWQSAISVEPSPSAAERSPQSYWEAAQSDSTIVIPISSTGAGGDPGRLVIGRIVDG